MGITFAKITIYFIYKSTGSTALKNPSSNNSFQIHVTASNVPTITTHLTHVGNLKEELE